MAEPTDDRWKFQGSDSHGQYYYKCEHCGEMDWIASYGTKEQLGCKCDELHS